MALSARLAQICNKRSRHVVQEVFARMGQPARVANSTHHQAATVACADAEATRRAVHDVFGKMRASSTRLAVEDTFRQINDSAATDLASETPTLAEKQRDSVSAIFNLMNERDATVSSLSSSAATSPRIPQRIPQYHTMMVQELLAADNTMSTFRLLERGARARVASDTTAYQRASVDAIFDLMHDGDLQADATRPQADYITATHHRAEDQRNSVDAIFNLMSEADAPAVEATPPPQSIASIFRDMEICDAQVLELAAKKAELSRMDEHRQADYITATHHRAEDQRNSVDAIFNLMNEADAPAVEATPPPQSIASIFRDMEICDAQVLELAAKEAELSRMDEHRQGVVSVSKRGAEAETIA